MGIWQGGRVHIKYKHLTETAPLPLPRNVFFYPKKKKNHAFKYVLKFNIIVLLN